MLSYRALVLTLGISVAAGGPVAAQSAPPPSAPATPSQSRTVAPPSADALSSDRGRRLDELFSRLKDAATPRAARVIEREIAMVLARSGSDTADLLMARAMQALERQDQDLSLSLLDAVVDLNPTFIEALNRRATLYVMRREVGRAVADIEQVLRLEPRHFGAMVTLGTVLQQIGDDGRALLALRSALEINPQLERVPEMIKRLEPKVDGRPI